MKNLSLLMLLTLLVVGCNSGSNNNTEKQQNNTSKVVNLQVATTPSSFENYALLSSGKITVKGTLETDGPLADVHSNENIETTNARNINIMGRMTSYDGIIGTNFRSVETDNMKNGEVVDFRALKVHEYDLNDSLPDAYILKADGTFVKRFNSQETLADSSLIEANLTFVNDKWKISGSDLKFDIPIKSETSLDIDVDKMFVAGTIMVEGNLEVNGKLNINTGTPFEYALIVDNDIEVDSFECIGKVFGSGKFTSHKTVNITGSVTIDGDVNLGGITKVNYLDTVYKAAMSDAEDDLNTTDFMLAHSRLFSDLNGKNSVVLFTFVKGNYLMDEKDIIDLIETNQTDAFEFKSYIYGASLEYGSDLAEYNGLSPYYAKKIAVEKKLKAQGHQYLDISESIDIAPQSLYHTYVDKNGTKIGTYLIDSLAPTVGDELYPLSDEQREDAYKQKFDEVTIEENKEHIEEEKVTNNVAIPNKDNIDIESIKNDTNLSQEAKDKLLAFVEENSDDKSNIALEKQEAKQDRIKEWTYEKNIEGEIVTVDTQIIEVNNTKRFFSGLRRWASKKWRQIKHSVCRKNWYRNELDYVYKYDEYKKQNKDGWSNDIAYGNPEPGAHCTPVAAAMSIRYLAKRYGKTNKEVLYDTNFKDSSSFQGQVRWNPIGFKGNNDTSITNPQSKLVTRISKEIGIRKATSAEQRAYDRYVPGTIKDLVGSTIHYVSGNNNKLPGIMRKILSEGGISANVWNETNYGWWFTRAKYFNKLKSDINTKTPALIHIAAHQGIYFHSVVVIGYKYKDYRGLACHFIPNKNYLLLGNGWNNPIKKRIRFDIRSNYFNSLPVSFTRMHIYSKTPAQKAMYSWLKNWFRHWRF